VVVFKEDVLVECLFSKKIKLIVFFINNIEDITVFNTITIDQSNPQTMSQFYNQAVNASSTTHPYERVEVNETEEEEVVIYIDSFFIPYVAENITLDTLVDIIERSSPYKGEGDNSIGIVEKIESIPKVNAKTGRAYYSCFVTLKSWSQNVSAHELMMRLYNDNQSRLYFKDNNNVIPQYLHILPNKSETSLMPPPKHMDLLIYLHTDVRLETVMGVIEGLDIGKVYSIEAELLTSSNNSSNGNTCQLKWVNQDIWRQKVNCQHNVVIVTMEYWYKTQTAYAFQKEMENATYVDVPVFDGTVWTMYETSPKLLGVNPYVWERKE
jgi:hypothetical protein